MTLVCSIESAQTVRPWHALRLARFTFLKMTFQGYRQHTRVLPRSGCVVLWHIFSCQDILYMQRHIMYASTSHQFHKSVICHVLGRRGYKCMQGSLFDARINIGWHKIRTLFYKPQVMFYARKKKTVNKLSFFPCLKGNKNLFPVKTNIVCQGTCLCQNRWCTPGQFL